MGRMSLSPGGRRAGEARRVGGVLLAAGVLLLVGNALHPFLDTVGEAAAFVDAVGSSPDYWAGVHLTIGVGLVVLAFGIVGLGRLVEDTPGEVWGHAGVVVGVLGIGVFTVQIVGLDGIAVPALVTRIDEAGVSAALEAVVTIDLALLAVAILLLVGASNVLLGVAVTRARLVSGWIGATFVAGGAVGLVAGTILVVAGPSELAVNVLFRIAAAMATVAILAAGWVLWRRAPAGAAQPGEGSRAAVT